MRTARSMTSGEYLGCFFMTPFSQTMEPLQNPGRFNHPCVFGDRNRLVQVVANLLNNGAKYTPEGGAITATVHSNGSDAFVEVEDNGIGIDMDFLPHVFDLFAQAKRTPDRSQGGLGIGLALVKSIVELHGGDITVTSHGPATGAVFRVSLPLTPKIQTKQKN
jgi:signal transduction histidine kinase